MRVPRVAGVRTSSTLGRYSSAIRAACANERSCGSARGAISNGCPYRDLIDPVLSEMAVHLIRHSPGDNLARCLTILMRAPVLLNALDLLRRLCLLSSSGCSSGYCLSARLDGSCC